ncbi:MAG: GPW/gp25 family protein [Chloroflexi bacterium]|nr:GPW/gp25 family protein [Chloroflexota bacterium]MDA0245278.1 GPW/gp25 family protein [Chloroflexota bacterium]
MSKDIVGQGWAFPLGIGPQGGFAMTRERSELEQAVDIILSTRPGERVMRGKFGSKLHELYFEPNNQQTAMRAVRYVEEALAMWEPRIIVQKVTAEPDPEAGNRLLIYIDYTVKASNDERSLVYPFYMIPDEE